MSLSPWSTFEPANVSFCEPRLDGWIVEPANAWSNVAYIAVAIWLLNRALRDKRQVLLLIGATSFLVGLGSFAFHATGTFIGQYCDEGSMFLISSLMVTLSLRRLRGWSSSTCVRVYVAMSAFSLVLLAVVKTSGILTFMAQIGTTMGLEFYLSILARRRADKVNYRPLWIAFGMYWGASLAWFGDLFRIVCKPESAHVFNGHVVWHVITALCLAVYYRFEEQFTGGSPLVAASEYDAVRLTQRV